MRRVAPLVALAALLAPTTPVWAFSPAAPVQASSPAAPAQAAAPISALVGQVDIPYSKFTLDNGLTVICLLYTSDAADE